MRHPLAVGRSRQSLCRSRWPPRSRARRPTPSPRSPARSRRSRRARSRRYTVCKKRLRLPHDPGGRRTRRRPATRSRSSPAPTARPSRSAAPRSATCGSSATRRTRRKVVLEGTATRSRTASSSTAPTRSRSTASRPATTRANGVLRHQRRRLHAARTWSPRRPAPTASTPSTPRAARCANSRGLLQQRRRLLHRADAAAGQADPLDRAQRHGWGNPIGFAARTCAT